MAKASNESKAVHTGAQLRAMRERCSMKRTDVEKGTSITAARISRMESGAKFTHAEETVLIAFYVLHLPVPSPNVASWPDDPRALPSDSQLNEVMTEGAWNGIMRGDPVKIEGAGRAKYTFIAYRQPDKGEPYVEVIGGVGSRRTTRCFAPERVTPVGIKGRRART